MATTPAVTPVAVKRGYKRDSKRTSTRGRSLPMALKARVGRPAPQATDSSDDASDTGVQIRPQALPVYRAGTNYAIRRQHLTGQHADSKASRDRTKTSVGHMQQNTESVYSAGNTIQNWAEQRHLEDDSAPQQEILVRTTVSDRRGSVETLNEVGILAPGGSTTRTGNGLKHRSWMRSH